MTQKHQILIQKYVDGELSLDEKIFIESLINDNPDARSYYQDIKSVQESLEEGAKHVVDIDLKEKIMKEIRKTETQNVYSMKSSYGSINVFGKMRWNIAYAFILGLIVGAFIIVLVPKKDNLKDIDESQISGSILSNMRGNAFTLPVDIQGAHLNLSADKLNENYFRILIEVQTDDQGVVNLSFNKSGFYLQSMKMLGENDQCRMASNRTSVQLYNAGENSYILLMKKLSYLAEEIKIQVYLDEMMKYENVVVIN